MYHIGALRVGRPVSDSGLPNVGSLDLLGDGSG
jgi:hypothetical protein